MRRATVLYAIATFACSGILHAQEEVDEGNLEYQKLKVLEPLVGEYHFEGVNEETGAKREGLMTIAWSASKKMLKVETRGRMAAADEDLSKKPWWSEPTLTFFAWSRSEGRIEAVSVGPWGGKAWVSEVVPKENGVFAFTGISATHPQTSAGDFAYVITKSGVTARFTHRVGADGDTPGGWEMAYRRVKKDEQVTPGYEQLKFLEPLIGTWTTDLVAPQDHPATGIKAGTKGQFCLTYEWCNKKNGILVREQSTWEGSTETIEYGVALIGWDHAARKIIAKRLGNTTGWSTPIYNNTDNGWIVNTAKTRPDGVKVREDHTLKLSGDTLVAQAINRFEGDKKLDDGIVLEFKRKK